MSYSVKNTSVSDYNLLKFITDGEDLKINSEFHFILSSILHELNKCQKIVDEAESKRKPFERVPKSKELDRLHDIKIILGMGISNIYLMRHFLPERRENYDYIIYVIQKQGDYNILGSSLMNSVFIDDLKLVKDLFDFHNYDDKALGIILAVFLRRESILNYMIEILEIKYNPCIQFRVISSVTEKIIEDEFLCDIQRRSSFELLMKYLTKVFTPYDIFYSVYKNSHLNTVKNVIDFIAPIKDQDEFLDWLSNIDPESERTQDIVIHLSKKECIPIDISQRFKLGLISFSDIGDYLEFKRFPSFYSERILNFLNPEYKTDLLWIIDLFELIKTDYLESREKTAKLRFHLNNYLDSLMNILSVSFNKDISKDLISYIIRPNIPF